AADDGLDGRRDVPDEASELDGLVVGQRRERRDVPAQHEHEPALVRRVVGVHDIPVRRPPDVVPGGRLPPVPTFDQLTGAAAHADQTAAMGRPVQPRYSPMATSMRSWCHSRAATRAFSAARTIDSLSKAWAG